MRCPEVSVIIPFYNAEEYVDACMESLFSQTLREFEIICIVCGTTDSTIERLKHYAEADERVRIFQQDGHLAGAARNLGLSHAVGQYVLFLDSDNILTPDCLDRLHDVAEIRQAEIVACNFFEIRKNGERTRKTGIHTDWISGGKQIFNYQDCTVNILRIAGMTIWNKLYRRDFIQNSCGYFDEALEYSDLPFVSVSMVMADRIAYCTEALVSHKDIRWNSSEVLKDVHAAVCWTVEQLKAVSHYARIQNALSKFVIETYITAMKQGVTDFAEERAAEFYRNVHAVFNNSVFRKLTKEDISNEELFRAFLTIQKHDYSTMKQLSGKRLIVSLTSFPGRIVMVPLALKTIQQQTRRADRIILWLAEEQFPGKESDLPESVKNLLEEGTLEIRWCDDLRAHKKYFYALQEFKDSLVVTIDDDLLYPKDMLKKLWESYLLYPKAVSAMRCHLIVINEKKEVLPYNKWIKETDACIHQPSMQLIATGGAGTLYPPDLFDDTFFDKEAIMENCPLADDLWLKAIQAVSDIPVVLVSSFSPLKYIEGSQEETLYSQNVGQNKNDTQFANISQWMDRKIYPGVLVEKLANVDIGCGICGVAAVSEHLNQEREKNRWKRVLLDRQVAKAEENNRVLEREKQKAINRIGQLQQQVENSRCEINKVQNALTDCKKRMKDMSEEHKMHVAMMEDSLRSMEARQRATEQALLKERENAPVNMQLRNIGRRIAAQKNSGSAVRYYIKLFVYCLAWIPETILAAMMYFLQNGAKQTLKQIYRKLFCRRG